MIKLGPIDADWGGAGKSKVALYVLERLPDDYMVNEQDLQWLDECDRFLTDAASNESVTAATKAALSANPRGHIDPFELLIDANICDRKCEPVPSRED